MSQNSSCNNNQGRKPNISNSSQSNSSENNSKVVHTVNTTNVKTNTNSMFQIRSLTNIFYAKQSTF